MKILHLVLYSRTPEFHQMYKTTKKYYKLFKNVKTIYYRFNNDITNDYELNGDILFIKGNETYVPGILDKTIKALLYFDCNRYDYVVRTNISTIINFKLLINYLNNNQVKYGGGFINDLQWLDYNSGVVDNSLFGTKYASGTAIIMDNNTINYFKNNLNKIRKDLVDDLSIGLLLKDIEKTYIGKIIIVPELNNNYDNIKKDINEIIFYRNRNPNRNIDAIQMKEIIRILIENHN